MATSLGRAIVAGSVLAACVGGVGKSRGELVVSGVLQTLSFEQRIERVISSVATVREVNDELYVHPLMREMFEHPDRFRSDIQKFILEHPNLSSVEARVATMPLQCLTLEHFLGVLEWMAKGGRGSVGERALLSTVMPGFEVSTRLALRFRDGNVRKALQAVIASPNANDDIREGAKDLLNGVAARYVKENGAVPILSCSSRGRDATAR